MVVYGELSQKGGKRGTAFTGNHNGVKEKAMVVIDPKKGISRMGNKSVFEKNAE